MIPARVRVFSIDTIMQITGLSRTTLWRRNYRGRLGADVVGFIQKDRADAGIPPLTDVMEAEVLAALVSVEDAKIARNAEKHAA